MLACNNECDTRKHPLAHIILQLSLYLAPFISKWNKQRKTMQHPTLLEQSILMIHKTNSEYRQRRLYITKTALHTLHVMRHKKWNHTKNARVCLPDPGLYQMLIQPYIWYAIENFTHSYQTKKLVIGEEVFI